MKLCPILLATLLAACTPAIPAPAPPAEDAADGGDDLDLDGTSVPAGVKPACASLKANGCPEGIDPSCVAVLAKAVRARITSFNLPCLVTAKSQTEIRACGPAVKCAAAK